MKNEKVAELFATILELPIADRETYFERTVVSKEIREKVAELLAAHDAAGDFLEKAAPEEAAILVESMNHSIGIGYRIGAYRVIREIGRGGMGIVFLAERVDEDFHQRVALKVIRGGGVSEVSLKRFVRERRILAGLEHPGVARLLDGGLTDRGDPYFAMEYVEGEPLNIFCDRERLSIEERLLLFREVCETVQYAHGNLVVHRDLKPSNILVTADGKTKLLDFGIAKLLIGPVDSSETLTMDGQLALTPQYAAPEQVRGERVTTTTDVYSLGVILYGLLSGHRPYVVHGKKKSQLANIVCHTKASPPSQAILGNANVGTDFEIEPQEIALRRGLTLTRLQRRLKGDLDKVVLKAMRKEPGRRYGSAEALADDVERHLAGLPVRARPDTLRYRTSKFIRRHRYGVIGGLLLTFTLAFGLTTTIWQASIASKERDRSQQEAIRAEEVNRILVNMLASAAPLHGGPDVRVVDILDQTGKELDLRTDLDPNVTSRLRARLGLTYLDLGLPIKARETMQKNEGLNGVSWSQRLVSASVRMEVLDVLGANEECLQMGSGILRQVETEEVDGYLLRGIYNRLAECEIHLGHYEKAQENLDKSWALSQVDPSHEVDGETFLSQGNFYISQSLFKEGEEAFLKAISSFEQAGIDGRYRVMSIKFGIASAMTQQGRLHEADALFADIVDYMEDYLGDTHPTLMKTYANYAGVLQELGRYESALDFNRQAEGIALAIQGESHPALDSILMNRGNILISQGLFHEAEGIYLELNRVFEEKHGSNHAMTLINQFNLAELYIKAERFSEATAILQPAIERARKSLGDRHQIFLEIKELVGWGYVRNHQIRRGMSLIGDVLEVKEEVLGDDNPRTINTRVRLASALMDLGRSLEAREIYEKAYADRKRVLGEKHPSTQEMQEVLSNLPLPDQSRD